MATECLYSVPINRKVALEQLSGMERYVHFQSTLAFLKNPPKEDSFQAPQSLDLIAQIKELSHRVRAKEITKEYDFELQLRLIFANANDGHLTGALGGVFAIQFMAPFDIVSVSKDGVSLPEIYRATLANGQLEPVGPAIVEIDGLPVVDYLNKIAFGNGLQSPHARYNSLFPGKGLRGGVLNNGYFRNRRRYPGKDGFSVKFADGTTEDFQFFATIAGDFKKVTNAASFYDVFVKGGQMLKAARNPRCGADSDDRKLNRPGRMGKKPDLWKTPAESIPVSEPEGDLQPVLQDAGGIFAGFFLKSDTAVIQLLSFAPECWSDVPATIKTIGRFLDMCRQKGTKKLILDITNNGGGYIMMGYDLFMQLFPKTLPYSGQRNRANPGGLIEAEAFSHLNFKDLEALAYNSTTSSLAYAATWSNWAYAVTLDQEYKPYKSADDLVGHVKVNDDRYSEIWRFNVTEPLFGLGVQNYLSQPLEPVFDPKNIVVLGDSRCSSTCSTFSEFMQTQKKIKSVVVGGIPISGGQPLVGGVRGTEILSFTNLLDAARAVNVLSPTQDPEEQSRRRRDLPQPLPLPISGNVNSLDNVRIGQTTPLQFIEDHATCRMFHTTRTLGSITALWEAVDDAAFGSGKGCVSGSLQD
ncbi:hypothetical protein Dda_9420 [Drechslerella dactyloides]|uniref:Tail specific protease domain-containing protein n=1 Tax=Drechslerella dactyloides TaxID=74499 RepID=A0AAD6IQS2_DREDA|nr:hypothetical protein Dda_9420 [Drechslerella dactyloides]